MVDAHRIDLEFADGNVRLECSERDWYAVSLASKGKHYDLGAERLGYLTRHLTAFLRTPAPRWKWVLSLSERHCSVYGQAGEDGGILTLLQNADAGTIAEIRITNKERETWLRTLQALL